MSKAIAKYLTFCVVADMLFYLIFKFRVFMALTFPINLRNKDIFSTSENDVKSMSVVAKDTKRLTKPSKLDMLEKYVNPVTILLGGLFLIVGFAIYAIPATMMAESLKGRIETQIAENADFNKDHVVLNTAYADLDFRAIGEVKSCAINAVKRARINAFNLWTYREIAVQQHVRFLEKDCSEYAKAESFSRFPKEQGELYRQTIDKVIYKSPVTITTVLATKDKTLEGLYE